jgi:monoamine oxidase
MPSLSGTRVIIAGAGLAGLCAARTLSRRGAEVHLVEARDRLGGRVWTLRDPQGSFHVEAGGEFIDGEHEAIRSLVSALRLRLIRVLRGGFGLALETQGRVRVSTSQSSAWKALAHALRPAARVLDAAGRDWHAPAARAIARHSLADVLAATKAPPRVCGLSRALRGFYLADPERLSALVAVEQTMASADPGRATMFRIDGGNDRLVYALARRAHATVSMRHVLRAVTQDARGVRACVEGPQGRRSHLHADYAVITLPVSVVRECQFDPALPDEQQRAMATLRYGEATKAFLQFDDRWWRKTRRPRAFGSNLPIGAVWEAAEEQRGAAILTLLAGGSASTNLQALLGGRGAAAVIEQLAWLGTARGGRLATPSVTWEHDPWSRGGYAVFGPDFDPRSWRALSQSHGRVVFAGEHTSRYWQGFMNGAVESGLKAANEVEQLERVRRWIGERQSDA